MFLKCTLLFEVLSSDGLNITIFSTEKWINLVHSITELAVLVDWGGRQYVGLHSINEDF